MIGSSVWEGIGAVAHLNNIGENQQCPVETERRVRCLARVVAEGMEVPLNAQALALGQRLLESGPPEPQLKPVERESYVDLCAKCGRRKAKVGELCHACRQLLQRTSPTRTCCRCGEARSTGGTRRWKLLPNGDRVCTKCIRKESNCDSDTSRADDGQGVLGDTVSVVGMAR